MTRPAGGNMAPPPATFDAIAADYDARFSDHPIARRLRARVWRAAETVFPPGAAILDIGCGTGIDAWHLAARGLEVIGIDPSAAMVAVARARAAAEGDWGGDVAGARELVDAQSGGEVGTRGALRGVQPRFVVGTVSEWATSLARQGTPSAEALPALARFDGALANFGSLNAVPDLPVLGASLAALLRPGAPFVAVVMSPFCAWETAYHASRRDLRRAVRRWRPGGGKADLGSGAFTVHYPGPVALAHALGPRFRLIRHGGLGVVLPPTWATGPAGWLVAGSPRRLALANRLDAALGTLLASSYVADHYLAVFERRP